MKGSLRQAMIGVHTWSAMIAGWVLYFIFLTGAAGYFDTEIDQWMQPELGRAPRALTPERATAIAIARLSERAPDAARWRIELPGQRETPWLRISWQTPPDPSTNRRGGSGREVIDTETGLPALGRDTGGGQTLYRMHWQLHYLPRAWGEWIVIVSSLLMGLALVTGVIAHKRIFVDFFTFRPGKGQRSWLDAHNVISVVALPFFVVITYSGLVFYDSRILPLVIASQYGAGTESRSAYFAELSGGTAPLAAPPTEPAPARTPPTIQLPQALTPMIELANTRWGPGRLSDIDIDRPTGSGAKVLLRAVPATPLRRAETLVVDGSGRLLPAREVSAGRTVRDILLSLHEGLYAGALLRSLYFLSSLLGAAMVGTGLVLFVVKRRRRMHAARGPAGGVAWTERMNVGVIAGLPIGIAAYFWANRLLPIDLAARAEWEANALFATWGTAILHAVARPAPLAWPEQMRLAAFAFAMVPALNAALTDRHLGTSLPAGDWAIAGFDLTMLAFGAAFACAARRVSRAQPRETQADAPSRTRATAASDGRG